MLKLETHRDPDRTTTPARLAIAAVAFACVVLANQVDLGIHRFGVPLLNANWQFSWSHDLEKLLLVGGAAIAVMGARRDDHPKLWGATAVMLAIFFLDEISPLHSQVGQNTAKLVYAPILVGLVICLWRLARSTDEEIVIAVGLGTLFFSFGMHVVGLHLLRPTGYYTGVYQAAVGVKEGAELAGLLMVVPGLWRLATRRSQPRAGLIPVSASEAL